MKFTPVDPPRTFRVGQLEDIELSDCGRVELEPDEQVTFVTASGTEFDVARKDWGYYATPSLNRRLPSFGLRGALAVGTRNTRFLLLVERGKEAAFEAYLERHGMRIERWLDGGLDAEAPSTATEEPAAPGDLGEREASDLAAHNAEDYERRYRSGYGLAYPESHVIRVHRHVLEWELGITSGRVFDFGCGSGGNLRFFQDEGFEVHGCDTSEAAIAAARGALPGAADRLHVSSVRPDLASMVAPGSLDVFLSNQVLYFLEDAAIREVVAQAYSSVRPGGAFVATMMAPTCFYRRFAVETRGELTRVAVETPRQNFESWINFKDRDQLAELFSPFQALHVGRYGSDVREEEGSTDHWLFVGRKPTREGTA